MFRITKACLFIPALLSMLAATAVGMAHPGSASALGTMKATSDLFYKPERLCRPHTTCMASWTMTVKATVPLSPGETIGSDYKVVMPVVGEDTFSDDKVSTLTIPYRAPTAKTPVDCSDDLSGFPKEYFYQSGNTVVIRGCFTSPKRYGPFNEDSSILDEWDELLTTVKLVNASGKTVRSATTRELGRF